MSARVVWSRYAVDVAKRFWRVPSETVPSLLENCAACTPGGSLVVAVMYGSDELQYNAHRVYGELRWPYLASNWLQVHRESTGEQRVHVFVK